MQGKIIPTILTALLLITFGGCSSEEDINEQDLYTQKSKKKYAADWQEINPGLSYTELTVKMPENHNKIGEKDLLIVKIDPKKHILGIYQNPSAENSKTMMEIHKATHSLVTFNGGYFTEDFKPTGLLISNGEKIRDLSSANLLNGILAIGKNGEAHLLSQNDEIDEEQYEFAIQNGPVLIGNDGNIKITEDDRNRASRTVIGIDNEDNLVLIILKQNILNTNNSISLYNLAHLIQEAPELKKLGVKSVLNLDGGSSTGLMIDGKYYSEMEKVQNAITVKNR